MACFALPATASYFKNQYYPGPYAYSINMAPVLNSSELPGIVVNDDNEWWSFVVSPGGVLNVSLIENDPYQNWIFGGAEGALYVGNSLIESYPVKHVFKLKAEKTGIILLRLVDDRNGKTVRTFMFRLVVDPQLSGTGGKRFSGDLVPSFGWPVQLKF
jgi:hypothetical protein